MNLNYCKKNHSTILGKVNFHLIIAHHAAQGLQWLHYSQSEIRPYIEGYLHFTLKKGDTNSKSQNSRDLAYQQKQRATKLVQALTCLDNYLRSRTFMVGQRLTLADTHLSIEILPLFDIKLNGQPLIKVRFCQKVLMFLSYLQTDENFTFLYLKI